MTTGYCDQHRINLYDRQRGTSASRGYDRDWQKVRAYKLDRDPVCEICQQAVATQVHHVRKIKTHPELRLVVSNLQSVCVPCHNKLTIQGL